MPVRAQSQCSDFRRRRSTNIQRWRSARNVENAFNDENASGSMECATCRSGSRTLPITEPPSSTSPLRREATGWNRRQRGRTCALRRGLATDRMMVARSSGPSDSRRSRHRRSRRLISRRDADRRLGEPWLGGPWCTAVSEKSLFIQGILLTRISISWIRSRDRSSTSSMNGRDSTGRTCRCSGWLSKTDWIALRHRNL